MAIESIINVLPSRHMLLGLSFLMALIVCCAGRAAEAQSEFVPSHKTFGDYVRMGFDIKGTWGGHVIILQKGQEVAFCDVILKNDLFSTLREGCVEVNRQGNKQDAPQER